MTLSAGPSKPRRDLRLNWIIGVGILAVVILAAIITNNIMSRDLAPDPVPKVSISQQAPSTGEHLSPETQLYLLEYAWSSVPVADQVAICSSDTDTVVDQLVTGVTTTQLDPALVEWFVLDKCGRV